jgi:hypothetical protein
MDDAQRNYDIWDKEMLAIIWALEEWRYYVLGLPQPVEIWSDHKNLEDWATSQHLSRRQARWYRTLQEYNFVLCYKKGTTNGQADALSWRLDHYREDSQDNQNIVVLQPSHFKIAAAQRGHVLVDGEKEILTEIRNESKELLNSLTQIVKIGPRWISQGLTDWETEDGLVLYQDKVFVPPNYKIKQKIMAKYHDSVLAGHPGRWKTLELISQNYYWVNMTKEINQYVDSCLTYQANKPSRQQLPGHLQPLPIPGKP